MSSTFNRRLDAVSKSRVVAQASWNMALAVRVTRTCTCMLREYEALDEVPQTDLPLVALTQMKFRKPKSSAKIFSRT